MSFTKKRIEVTFTLAPVKDLAGNVTVQPVFAGKDANRVTLKNLRVSARIQKAGGASMGESQLRIFGMPLKLMNQLSTLGRTPVILGKNGISVAAGEGEAQAATIFDGTITQAYIDLGGAPEGVFVVSAYSLAFQSTLSIPPTSIKGPVDVATIMQTLATQMGLSGFVNDGVNVKLPTSYFEGSAKTQAEAVVKAAGIEWNAGDNGVLAIWPKNGYRNLPAPTISAATGMVGYPYPSGQGLLGVRTRFNPNINFGAPVIVQSTIVQANGTWKVVSLQHEIESEMPGGQWFTSIMGTPPGYLTVQG